MLTINLNAKGNKNYEPDFVVVFFSREGETKKVILIAILENFMFFSPLMEMRIY